MTKETSVDRAPVDAVVMPRVVFRVCYVDDRAVVMKRRLISRNGSWFEFELSDGRRVKENGLHWHDTMIAALQAEAHAIMHRFRMPKVFDENKTFEEMCCVIDEAVEVGQLLGMCRELDKA